MKKFLSGLWAVLTTISVCIIATTLATFIIWCACQIFIMIHGILMYGG